MPTMCDAIDWTQIPGQRKHSKRKVQASGGDRSIQEKYKGVQRRIEEILGM